MWGSSLPNRFFLDLEITFNFAHSFLSLFLLFFVLLYSLFFSHHYHPFLPFFIYTLYTSYFTVSSNRFSHQLLPVIYLMLVIQFSVSSTSVIRCHNHILYNEELFHSIFPWFKKINFSDNRRIGHLF